MMRNALKLILLTLPLIGAGVGYLAFTVQTKAPPDQVVAAERAVAVRVIPARAGAVAPTLRGYGLVTPAETFEAIAQVSGTVAWTNPGLQRGVALPAGTPLLRIAEEDYDLALAQAEANLRAAEAKLDELAVSQDNQRAALEIEREALALKAADLARARSLFEGGNLPQSGLDNARSAELVQRQKVQGIEAGLALIPTQRAVQQEQIAVSRAAAEAARLNLGRTTLTLPIEARVASVTVEAGRFLRSGEVAATLDGTGVAEVEAQVPVARLRALLRHAAPDAAAFAADPAAMTMLLQSLSLKAEVRLVLGNETLTWPARVARVSETIDPRTGMLGVIVEVEDAYSGAAPAERPPLTKGMFVEVEIAGKPVEGLVVPRAALSGNSLWLVGADDRLVAATVAPLLKQDELAVIGEGLDAGARVVASDIPFALPGMLLAPVEDDALAAAMARAR